MKACRLGTPGERIKCSGCGKHAPESGFVVPPAEMRRMELIISLESRPGIDEDTVTQPLCETCLATMERAESKQESKH